MTELKTKPTAASVEDFLAGIADEQKRKDSLALLELMRNAAGVEPVLWGSAIVGFGTYHYHYTSGREADWPVIGFSPRKQALTLYFMEGLASFPDLLARLGPHKTGKGCLYIKRLKDVNLPVLEELLRRSAAAMQKPD